MHRIDFNFRHCKFANISCWNHWIVKALDWKSLQLKFQPFKCFKLPSTIAFKCLTELLNVTLGYKLHGKRNFFSFLFYLVYSQYLELCLSHCKSSITTMSRKRYLPRHYFTYLCLMQVRNVLCFSLLTNKNTSILFPL